VPSSYPGDERQIEVTPSGELMISLHGTNYAPTPMLTCVYRYYDYEGPLFDELGYHSTSDEHQEYWVQAVFENAGYVRCPVPTRRFADPGANALRSSTMPLSATNDGMIYHYSNHSYEQVRARARARARVRVRVRVRVGVANHSYEQAARESSRDGVVVGCVRVGGAS
jgi:hypothetical protein